MIQGGTERIKARTYTTTSGVEDPITDLLLGRFGGLVDAV